MIYPDPVLDPEDLTEAEASIAFQVAVLRNEVKKKAPAQWKQLNALRSECTHRLTEERNSGDPEPIHWCLICQSFPDLSDPPPQQPPGGGISGE